MARPRRGHLWDYARLRLTSIRRQWRTKIRGSDLLPRRRLAANRRHRRRRRRRRWRRGNRCRLRRGRVRGASRRDQRRRNHDGNQREANHFQRRTSVSSRVEGLKYTATLGKRPTAEANVEWGIPVPARWRNIGVDGIPRPIKENLAFTTAWSKLVCEAILFLSRTRRTDRRRRDCARRSMCARRAASSYGGPGAARSLGVGTAQTDGSGCQHQTRRADRERVQVGRRR